MVCNGFFCHWSEEVVPQTMPNSYCNFNRVRSQLFGCYEVPHQCISHSFVYSALRGRSSVYDNQNNSGLLKDGLHSLWKWLHPASHPGAVWFHSPSSLCARVELASYQPWRRESSFRHLRSSPPIDHSSCLNSSWKSCQNWWNRFRPLNRRGVTKVGLQPIFLQHLFFGAGTFFGWEIRKNVVILLRVFE